MTDRVGYSVRIFVPQGEQEGLRLVERSNWVGVGLVFPRGLFAEANERPEIDRTGVYILWGESETGSLPIVYVGEGDTVKARLRDHNRKKDFWTHGVFFTSKDQALNKAHVQHLEARLIELATAAKRCELNNSNVPQQPTLSEADQADAEGFLRDLLLCLPVIGVDYFEPVRFEPRVHGREYTLKLRGVEATGMESAKGFLVREGSCAALDETVSISASLHELRSDLIKNGALKLEGDHYRLGQNYDFKSPSTAAGVMLGGNYNGRIVWKDAKGRTLKEVQGGGDEG